LGSLVHQDLYQRWQDPRSHTHDEHHRQELVNAVVQA